MTLREWFSDKSRWCQRAFLITEDGNKYQSTPYRGNAAQTCIVGGIWLCYGDAAEAHKIICQVINHLELTPEGDKAIWGCLTKWNDNKGRVFEDIVSLVDELQL